jgi:hypothetical protein
VSASAFVVHAGPGVAARRAAEIDPAGAAGDVDAEVLDDVVPGSDADVVSDPLADVVSDPLADVVSDPLADVVPDPGAAAAEVAPNNPTRAVAVATKTAREVRARRIEVLRFDHEGRERAEPSL